MALAAIEQDIPVHELLHLAQFRGGELELLEAQITEDSPAVGKSARELDLPDSCRMFLVIRGDEPQPVGPDTVLQVGDKVIAVARVESEGRLHRELIGERSRSATTDGGGAGRRAGHRS